MSLECREKDFGSNKSAQVPVNNTPSLSFLRTNQSLLKESDIVSERERELISENKTLKRQSIYM